MTRYIPRVLCLLSLLTFHMAGTLAAEQTIKGLHYRTTITSRNLGPAGTAELWKAGDKFCFEKGLKSFVAAVIKNEDGLFQYNKISPRAGKYPPDSPRNNLMQALPGPTGDVKAFLKANDAKDAGVAEWEGKQIRNYLYTEKTTLTPCKLYVEEKTGKPVRLVLVGEGPRADTLEFVYTDYDLNADIPISKFRLPEGLTVLDMPDIGARAAAKEKATDAEKADSVHQP